MQLLPEPISLSDWWAMPQLSVGFFARGMQLLEPAGLASVNMLPAPREGEPLPSLELKLAAPLAENARIRHVLRDAATGQDLAAWPPTASGTTTTGDARGDEPGELAWWQGARAFQQVEVATLPGSATGPGPGSSSNGSSSGSAGRSTAVQVHFGGKSYVSVPHRLMSALPGPGTYLLEVQYVTDIPGGLPVRLDGLHAPLVFRLVETEVVLRAKVSIEASGKVADGLQALVRLFSHALLILTRFPQPLRHALHREGLVHAHGRDHFKLYHIVTRRSLCPMWSRTTQRTACCTVTPRPRGPCPPRTPSSCTCAPRCCRPAQASPWRQTGSTTSMWWCRVSCAQRMMLSICKDLCVASHVC